MVAPFTWRSADHPSARLQCRTKSARSSRSDPSKDGVAVVDVATRKTVKTLPAGKDPETFDVSPDGTRLYVSNEDADSASIVDLAERQSHRQREDRPGARRRQRCRPMGRLSGCTGETDHNITGIDTKSGEGLGTYRSRPAAALHPFVQNGAKAYVTNEVDGTVTVVDMSARKTMKTITMPEGSKPMGLPFRPTARRSMSAMGEAVPSRSSTRYGLDPIHHEGGHSSLGSRSHQETARSSTRQTALATTCPVIDAWTMQVVKTIPVGSVPWGIAIGPAVR